MKQQHLQELSYPKSFFYDVQDIGLSYTRQDALMASYGFEPIGDGAFATVYSHPKLAYVLKVFSFNDYCYREYVKLSGENVSNPHFPRFRGKVMAISDKLYAIRLEKLKNYMNEKVISAMKYYMTNLKSTLGVSLEKRYPLLRAACDVITHKQVGLCRIDIHSDNIMYRVSDKVPVIIDPWAPP